MSDTMAKWIAHDLKQACFDKEPGILTLYYDGIREPVVIESIDPNQLQDFLEQIGWAEGVLTTMLLQG